MTAEKAWRKRFWVIFAISLGVLSLFNLNWWITLPLAVVGAFAVAALSPLLNTMKVPPESILVGASFAVLMIVGGYAVRHLVTRYGHVHVPSIAVSGSPETAGGVTHTWSNFEDAGGMEGPVIPTGREVKVSCAVQGFHSLDGDPWWYRIASPPWNDRYYATADAFYNNGSASGSLRGTPFVDPRVPDCASGRSTNVSLKPK